MTIKLYMTSASPPVRAVLMTAKALGINLELKEVNVLKGETKTPEFLKLNPQHTVPVLDDNGVILWDSHAIMPYLVAKYGKNDSLYPTDIVKRAIVDQRLHFDTGVLFGRGLVIIGKIIHHGKKTIDQADTDLVNEIYEFLESFLEGRKWIAGDSVTIADYSIYNTLTAANVVVPLDAKKFPKVSAWLKKVDALPESDVTKEGLETLTTIIKSALAS